MSRCLYRSDTLVRPRAASMSRQAGKSARSTRVFLFLAIVLFPCLAHAYAGPGAGFAGFSSFWAIFVAFLYSFYALMTWPFRQLFRMIRNRNAYGKAKFKRAVILGFDGMDPELADRFMNDGKLPNLAKLRGKGTFTRLRTTFPAISPVAWSTFMTGVNPGKHNIFDFLNRDLRTYFPELSSARVTSGSRWSALAALGLGKDPVRLLRKSQPSWKILGNHGVFSTILRVPI